MTTPTRATAIGASIDRVEGREKVTGTARYAVEHPVERPAYAVAVQATVAKGRVTSLEDAAARAVPGVLAVLWHGNAPRLADVEDPELALFQSDRVAYRGQVVAAVVAESLEAARHAARLLRIEYATQAHDVELRANRPDLYAPETVNGGFATDSDVGDFDSALASAEAKVDETYTTPALHNNPMEPHAALAVWGADGLTVYDSSQGTSPVRDTLAKAFGLEPGQVRVVAEHVGGGFGSKGLPRPHVILAVMAALQTRRPVKAVLTRQQMFAVVGYRTPTIQRVRLGATPDGRLVAIGHDAVGQSSTIKEFAEQSAAATRWMYAAPNRRTTHRLARLDVPTPAWMRAPGECPGMFALESAMDELAIATGIDPVELRIRNEPEVDPERGIPFSSRNLVACLRRGAARFGWEERDPRPGTRRAGRRLVGTGVAASTYPAYLAPATATARMDPDGRATVRVNGTDIGTGARTALTQIAADGLDLPLGKVRVEIGDSRLPRANVAGGSAGTASWGSAVFNACAALRARLDDQAGIVPPGGLEEQAGSGNDARPELAYYAFGAQFVEVSVDVDTGEVRVPRLLGVFAAGRIVNPKTARSQLIGGMTMGVSMALHEEGVIDGRFGDYVNHDLAGYHVATCADIEQVEIDWIDEEDAHVNALGVKGIGEIGIVGTAAAVANAVHHATGIRVRDLPIRLDALLGVR